ncbi:hypothetical protein [Dongshaea marina]|uniref:hypothetical protein n=1 Tax=Dongshaea marina TaxID=2047966 RepID=UPI00131EDBB6|nr:hypothetical protein [Dongshaea marina]
MANSGRKLWLIAAVVLLSVFYLYTLYLATQPKVSLSYRLYYLEGKTLFWQGDSKMIYRPGQIMNFVTPSPFLSRKGWSDEISTDGVTLEGKGGLYFGLAQKVKGLKATVWLESPKPGAVIKVSLESGWTHTIRLANKGSQVLTFDLPGAYLKAAPNQLNFLSFTANQVLNFRSLQMKAE